MKKLEKPQFYEFQIFYFEVIPNFLYWSPEPDRGCSWEEVRVVSLPVDGEGVVRGGGAWQGDELHRKYGGALQGVEVERTGASWPSEKNKTL